MPQDRYNELLTKRGQIRSWEMLVAHDYNVNDLDHAEIRKAVAEGIQAKSVSLTAQNESIEDPLGKLISIKFIYKALLDSS